MSYTPTNWANGDVITTEKLNKIENGIVAANSGGGILKVGVTIAFSGGTSTSTLDKTWKQIADTVNNGGIAYRMRIEDYGNDGMEAYIDVVSYLNSSGGYSVTFGNGGVTFTTDNENGYPTYIDGIK